jgi:dienelactone hydrolase
MIIHLLRKPILFLTLAASSLTGHELIAQPRGGKAESVPAVKAQIWKKISGDFSPPEMWRNKFGNYRSPLVFYNGDPVRTKAHWLKRREEIRQQWHSMMGQWPDLITDQNYKVVDSIHRENFIQYRIRFHWTPNEETEGYLLIPFDKDSEKKPAVITVYYEPETGIGLNQPLRDFAYQLAKRGFITLSLGTTKATEAKTWSLYYPDLEHATVQPLSMLAYAPANAWHLLAKMPQVDSTRIGIMGHSFGGKWAMFASCLFEKFACAVWSDPGIVFDGTRSNINYWEPWYLGYHPPPWRKRGLISKENPARGLYPKLVSEGYDLHELHALMAPRPFLVSGGEEDPSNRWIPLNHTLAVNKLLKVHNRVAMTNRPTHSPTEESNEHAYLFFEYFLK